GLCAHTAGLRPRRTDPGRLRARHHRGPSRRRHARRRDVGRGLPQDGVGRGRQGPGRRPEAHSRIHPQNLRSWGRRALTGLSPGYGSMATMEPIATVLVADDDRAIRDSLERALELEGCRVRTVAGGVQALAAVHAEPVDLIVLDVMMPGVDGLGVARVVSAEVDGARLRMLTARVETPDRVAGLDAGADDYLAKPFELEELLARLRALLRRATPVPDGESAERPLTVGELRLDPRARRVWRGEREVELSKT